MEAIFTSDNLRFMMEGLWLTVKISLATTVISLIFGSILAVLRNYGNKFFAGIASIYIEIFRNTPLLLWILAIRFMVPIPAVYAAVLSFSLFTSAIIAEIVRGGLNSIPKGQFEAAYSQGFTTLQTLLVIVIPQCFRNIIPTLLSQITTTVKDTSFLAHVAIAEFTWNGRVVMGSLRTSTQIFLLYAFMGLIYFIINFTLSVIVRTMQKRKRQTA